MNTIIRRERALLWITIVIVIVLVTMTVLAVARTVAWVKDWIEGRPAPADCAQECFERGYTGWYQLLGSDECFCHGLGAA